LLVAVIQVELKNGEYEWIFHSHSSWVRITGGVGIKWDFINF